ncbi:hypothetical protein GCM10023340_21140 [Nocardioides marinquilinus]|uniref:Integral membrane protein n=1 Tax=Nocardioides marinquilinus TaxID=1210400 RepID=A0ABP9PRN3_9ACTN
MTSLLPPDARTRRPSPTAGQTRRDLAARRPLALVALAGGLGAAAAPLLVCLALGVTGWFLTDGGSHGTPRDGLRIGALSWLTAHGSGFSIDGVAITAVPLGLTLACAWAAWRLGHRVGTAVSGHGPDADGILDGQRDLVVPLAGALFAAGYLAVAWATFSLTATPQTDPDGRRLVLWALAVCLLAGVPAIAVGAGRAAIWTASLPATLRAGAVVARRTITLWLLVGVVAFLVALAVDLSTAANVMTQLGGGGGAIAVMVVLGVALLPNAGAFAGSYLLGPGFTVGAGTLVTPASAVLGPLPAFPMLAALPDEGVAPGWTRWLAVLPLLVAFLAAAWSQRAWPTPYYVEAAVRGVAGGIGAGVLVGLLASLAGGAVGPGRMRDVGPIVFDTLLHAVTAFGFGGLLGGLLVCWWQRRRLPVDVELD